MMKYENAEVQGKKEETCIIFSLNQIVPLFVSFHKVYKISQLKLLQMTTQRWWNHNLNFVEVSSYSALKEAYLWSRHTSMINLFAKIVNGFQSLTIFAKILHHRCLTGP